MHRKNVFEIVNGEREYQDKRWNAATTESKGEHSVEEFVLYMKDYLAEAQHILSREARQDAYPKALAIMRKVTAMGVSCMEQHGAPERK